VDIQPYVSYTVPVLTESIKFCFNFDLICNLQDAISVSGVFEVVY